jgi:C4-dicarboxylate-specific signal transduction histidine kinase
MEMHKVLNRQLKRLEINGDLPTEKQWQSLKKIVSKTYEEADQERYLLERAMELSSNEMLAINSKLSIAQKIARMGYWVYEQSSNIVRLSRELYDIYGWDHAPPAPSFEEFLGRIHEQNRRHLREVINKALSDGSGFDYEFRMKYGDSNVDGKEYRWCNIIVPEAVPKLPRIIVDGIAMDIDKRKTAEEEIAELQSQLVISARFAGMADISSSTLHNVGNVLNNASVSAEYLKDRIDGCPTNDLESLIKLLEQNISNFPQYIQTDPKGKYVPEYTLQLLKNIHKDYGFATKEIEELNQYIGHIKDIMLTQNDISRATGTNEKVFLPEVMDSALAMVSTSFRQYKIDVEKDYEETSFVILDKVKLLQMLVNLIRNAKESTIASPNQTGRRVKLSIKFDNSGNIIIMEVQDNGIGISEENMKKIFTMGFTTKERGHGLGLHMSAINAKEMGGQLTVMSKGTGQGATFTLTLPKVEADKVL